MKPISYAASVVLGIIALGGSAAADEGSKSKDPAELERRVEILTEEVQTLKERLVLPEKEELKSSFGLGPAASKIYRAQRGISIGGYGEFYVSRLVKDNETGKDFGTGEFLRYIQYIGYKFTDKLLVNAEIEFEHTTTEENYAGKGGSVSVEFAYLDYLAHPAINLRGGLLLLPVGFLNELHEPPFYHGNLRPEVERSIIPSTWRELGVGLFGEPIEGLSYKLYLVNGLDAERFDDGGWREGRQNGGRVLAEDFAVVARVDYDWRGMLLAGGSVYYGGADQNRIELNGNRVTVNTFLTEGHAQLRLFGLELRALAAYGRITNHRQLSAARFPDAAAGEDPETRMVAQETFGWYVEAAYDVWPLLPLGLDLYLAPYFRYERFDTQAGLRELPGRGANAARDRQHIEAGVTFKPHPQVVVKLNYRDARNDAGAKMTDAFTLGAGFVY